MALAINYILIIIYHVSLRKYARNRHCGSSKVRTLMLLMQCVPESQAARKAQLSAAEERVGERASELLDLAARLWKKTS